MTLALFWGKLYVVNTVQGSSCAAKPQAVFARSSLYPLTAGSDTVKCEKCGGELRASAKFCPWCGVRIAAATPAEKDDLPTEISEAPVQDEEPAAEEDLPTEISEAPVQDEETAAEEDLPTEISEAPVQDEEHAVQSESPDEISELSARFRSSGDDLYYVIADERSSGNDDVPVKAPKRSEKSVRFSKKHSIAAVAAALAAALGIAAVYIIPEYIIPYTKYKEAERLFDSGDFAAAEEAFYDLGNYEDSYGYITRCRYNIAIDMMENEQFEEAAKAFAELDGYAASYDLAAECLLRSAEVFAEKGEYGPAASAYYSAGRPDLAEELSKKRAAALAEAGDFFSAAEIASGYSEEEAKKYLYDGSRKAMQNGDLEAAAEGFARLGDHKDSAELLMECKYRIYTEDLSANGASDENIRGIHDMGDYKDCKDIFRKAVYEYANSLFDSGEYYEAALMFRNAGSYENSSEMLYRSIYELGISLEESDPDSAYSIFSLLGNYADSSAKKAASDNGGSGWYVDGSTSADGYYTSHFKSSDILAVSCTAGTDSPSAPVTLMIVLTDSSGTSITAECAEVHNSGYFSASIPLGTASKGNAEIVISVKDGGDVLRRFEITIG